jgi:acyl-CoA reductase-like NAD-dependent aldehyde dehydrogenase
MEQHKLKIVNPSTGEVIREVSCDNAGTLAGKMELLKNGSLSWRNVPLEERVRTISRFSELLESERKRLCEVLSSEVGKPLSQSRNEITGARARIDWLVNNAATYLADEEMFADANLVELIRYEPLGVICNISAWNYPYLVGVNVFVAALLAGNTVMYKPSEFATLTGIEINGLLKEAGLPENAFQLAHGGKATGECLLDMSFDGYFFTGSNKTGRYIYSRVAEKMVPCQCEMGGKDPLYVADDVEDVKGVASATADGAFYNAGQSCCAVERIYVHERIYEEYIKAFVEEVRHYKVGDPFGEGVYMGPVARKEQLTVLEKQIREALSKGARVLVGGKRISGKGYYFEPTVVVDVNHDMRLMREESFGPVIGIMKVRDDEEAIALMSDTEYGLTAAVYCAARSRAETILAGLDTGTGYWNCCDRVSAALPWSGRRNSGFGAMLSHAGFRALVKPRAYHLRNL